MTIEEIEAALARALPMRTPRFPPEESPRVKISALEDYLVQIAYANGDLYAAVHWLNAVIDAYKDQVEDMTGYEIALDAPRSRATQAQVIAAKRRVDPITFSAATHARQLRDSIRDQIKRFEGEEAVISRLYTLISGG